MLTFVQTGNESSVDRLMKQISNFMGDISDEFKIVVVEAIRVLTIKFPQKHRSLMQFLSSILSSNSEMSGGPKTHRYED